MTFVPASRLRLVSRAWKIATSFAEAETERRVAGRRRASRCNWLQSGEHDRPVRITVSDFLCIWTSHFVRRFNRAVLNFPASCTSLRSANFLRELAGFNGG